MVLGIASEHENLVFGSAFVARAVDWMQEGAHPWIRVLVDSSRRGLVALVARQADRVLSRAGYRSIMLELWDRYARLRTDVMSGQMV